MNASAETLELYRCDSCQWRYVPTDSPCPHCGAPGRTPFVASGLGRVAAATELVNPSEGWPAPHRLALVELAESVRLLAIVDEALPAVGSIVSVRRDGEVYRARSEPVPPAEAGRGEGESPRAGVSDASFEPPR